MRETCDRTAGALTRALGSPVALIAAATVIVAWALSGPIFGFSDTWQLVINTGTTVVTLLMVFVIQNAQNRDSKAVHTKLDELIRSVGTARDEFVNAEYEPVATHEAATSSGRSRTPIAYPARCHRGSPILEEVRAGTCSEVPWAGLS